MQSQPRTEIPLTAKPVTWAFAEPFPFLLTDGQLLNTSPRLGPQQGKRVVIFFFEVHSIFIEHLLCMSALIGTGNF